MAMRQHASARDGNLAKSCSGLGDTLHSGNSRLGCIHLVVNNTEKLGRILHRLSTPTGIYISTGPLIIQMTLSIIHQGLPLITSSRVFGNAFNEKVTLGALREVAPNSFDFDILEVILPELTDGGLGDSPTFALLIHLERDHNGRVSS